MFMSASFYFCLVALTSGCSSDSKSFPLGGQKKRRNTPTMRSGDTSSPRSFLMQCGGILGAGPRILFSFEKDCGEPSFLNEHKSGCAFNFMVSE